MQGTQDKQGGHEVQEGQNEQDGLDGQDEQDGQDENHYVSQRWRSTQNNSIWLLSVDGVRKNNKTSQNTFFSHNEQNASKEKNDHNDS